MKPRASKTTILRNVMSNGNGDLLNNEDRHMVREAVFNASLMRSTLLNKLIDPRRDIDLECGYPKELTTEHYRLLYDREGIAKRIVTLFPEESWVNDPEVFETEDPSQTVFETALEELLETLQLWSNLSQVDKLSGIGRFGVMLLGLDDGKSLSKPVEGIDEKGNKVGKAQRKLLYLRSFDEALVTIKSIEKDQTNPRFGKPTMYSMSFDSIAKSRTSVGEITASTGQDDMVHWSRVIHVFDNRETSEVYGVPRMQTLFNRLYDLRKLAGGSGEMFWKGAFPGISFEMDANARALTDPQKAALRDEVANYMDGLQRMLLTQGVKANSLPPQAVDPKNHVAVQLELISIALGIPKRIFMGSEQSQLASSQDTKAWNKRVARRQNKYLTPYLIRPTIDRLIAFGILPEPKEYFVRWPDLDAPSEKDQADVLAKKMEAFSKYIAGGVDSLIPPEEFLTMFANLSVDEVKQIMGAALAREAEFDKEAEETERLAAEEAASQAAAGEVIEEEE